eukprot:gene4777-biopygen3267
MRMKDTELACILSESDSFSAVADRLNSARTEEVKSLSGLLEEAAHDTYKVGASCICRIPVPPAAATPSAFTSNRSSTALQRWRDWDICTYNHLAEAMALLEPESAVCTVEQLLRYPFTAPVVQRLNPVCLPRPSQDIRMALRCPKNPLDAILAAASVLSHGFPCAIFGGFVRDVVVKGKTEFADVDAEASQDWGFYTWRANGRSLCKHSRRSMGLMRSHLVKWRRSIRMGFGMRAWSSVCICMLSLGRSRWRWSCHGALPTPPLPGCLRPCEISQ